MIESEAIHLSGVNIQWHPAFYAGLEIEFRRFHVEYEKEHQLTRGPLSIDLLIIKKLRDDVIDNEIGNSFRRYNIVEYKSPRDGLTIDDFYKVQGYACLYKAGGDVVNALPADEITVTYCRDTYPREMIRLLEVSGNEICEVFPGVYHVTGRCAFDTQIVVTSQLSKNGSHTPLRILTENAGEDDVRAFLLEAGRYTEPGDRARADAVLQAAASANMNVFNEIYSKGDTDMCQALREIMKDDIDREVRLGEARGEARGEVKGRAEERETAVNRLMQSTGWSEHEARAALGYL